MLGSQSRGAPTQPRPHFERSVSVATPFHMRQRVKARLPLSVSESAVSDPTSETSSAIRRMTECDTLPCVARAISVRLDEEALGALARLEATGLSRSQAIRKAVMDAADRLRRRESLAAEVKALEADELDRQEMLEVAALMESLRAPR